LIYDAMKYLGESILITDDCLDAPGPRIQFANEAMCKMSGYKMDEMIGKSPRMFQGARTDPVARAQIRRLLTDSRPCKVEIVNYRKDGTEYDVELFIAPLLDPDGVRTHFVSIQRDITDRKRVIEAKAESEALFRSIFENAPTGIAIKTMTGRFAMCNPAYRSIVGYDQAELENLHFSSLVHPDDRFVYMEWMDRLLRKDIPGFSIENRYVRRTGEFVWVQKFVSLLSNSSGHATHVIALVTDISSRRDLQQQILEIAAQEDRRIGHELHDNIQQQLTGIGLLSLNLSETLKRDSSPHTKMATRLTQEIKVMADEVHMLARGLVPVEVDADGLRVALTELAARVTEQCGLACEFHCDGASEVSNNFVATHLYRIAQECVTNAVKHSMANRLEISLTGNANSICLKVADDGCGMADPMEAKNGLGVSIMQYRAGVIGASFQIGRGESCGTIVACSMPRKEPHREDQ
jgi:two-component system, LuxR family, sensor kinase FixL